jgi:hypothetical protein
MIVKVQRPLGGHGTRSLPWLVYARDRRHMQRFRPTSKLVSEFGDDHKRYYEADLIKGQFILVRRVEEQAW